MSAVATDECGDSLHNHVFGERVHEDVQIDVGMRIHKTRRKRQTMGIDQACCCPRQVPDSSDLFADNAKTAPVSGCSCAIDDGSILDE